MSKVKLFLKSILIVFLATILEKGISFYISLVKENVTNNVIAPDIFQFLVSYFPYYIDLKKGGLL